MKKKKLQLIPQKSKCHKKLLWANKLDNLEETDKFSERHNLPRLNLGETENMNSLLTSAKIETVIKNLPKKHKSPGPDSFIGEFYQTFREELTPTLLKLFQKTAEKGKLPNSFCEATITLIPKADKDTFKKRNLQAYITAEYRCKNPQQDNSNPY